MLFNRRWFVLLLIVVIYAAGVVFDRSFVCNHLPSGLNLDAQECRTTFWWLGLLWPLTFLHLLVSSWWSALLALIVFVAILFFLGYSLGREERTTRFHAVLRYSVTLLTTVLATIAAYTVFAYLVLHFGWYTLTALVLVLAASAIIGIVVLVGSFRFWKGFGGRPEALLMFWLPLIIILLSVAIGADWLLKHSGGG